MLTNFNVGSVRHSVKKDYLYTIIIKIVNSRCLLSGADKIRTDCEKVWSTDCCLCREHFDGIV